MVDKVMTIMVIVFIGVMAVSENENNDHINTINYFEEFIVNSRKLSNCMLISEVIPMRGQIQVTSDALPIKSYLLNTVSNYITTSQVQFEVLNGVRGGLVRVPSVVDCLLLGNNQPNSLTSVRTTSDSNYPIVTQLLR